MILGNLLESGIRLADRVFIGIGSNLGDREGNLSEAIRLAEDGKGLSVVRVSSFYESEAWGVARQPRFVNAVFEARTVLGPRELLGYLKGIEAKMGRLPTERWGPRLIDMDIIFYGDRVIKEADFEVPHPRAQERSFVMAPLSEIAPDLVHPVLRLKVSEIARRIDKTGLKRIGD